MSANSQERKGNTMDYKEVEKCCNELSANPNYKSAESAGTKAPQGGGSFPTTIGKKKSS